MNKALLVDALKKPRTKFTMNLYRGTDDLRADLVVCHGIPLRPLRLSASAFSIYFTSASFPFSILITAISLGSTPFFSAQ